MSTGKIEVMVSSEILRRLKKIFNKRLKIVRRRNTGILELIISPKR